MRVVADGAVLDVLYTVGLWTQVFRLLVTVNARVEDRHPQEAGMNGAVRFMASSAFPLGHGEMVDLIAKITWMTQAALIQQVRFDLHASAGIMAAAALTLDEGWMERKESWFGQDQLRRLIH